MRRGPFLPPFIEVKDTGAPKGLAVYAARCFEFGELVERCPVLLVEVPKALDLPKLLARRVFNWGELTHQQKAHRETISYAIALGYGSLYNYGRPANLRYSAIRSTATLEFTAACIIEAGDELTINYDQGAVLADPSESPWAERHKVHLE